MVSRENKELIFALVLLLQYERERNSLGSFSTFASVILDLKCFFPHWIGAKLYMLWNIIHVRKHVCTCWWIVTPQTSKVNIILTSTKQQLVCLMSCDHMCTWMKESTNFHFKRIPIPQFPEKFDEFPFYLVTMLFTCPITSTVGRSRRLKIVACFQKWENCRMFPKMGRLPQCWLSTRRTLVSCRGSRRWGLGKCTSLPSTSETPRRNCSQYCRLQIKATQIQNAHYRQQRSKKNPCLEEGMADGGVALDGDGDGEVNASR